MADDKGKNKEGPGAKGAEEIVAAPKKADGSKKKMMIIAGILAADVLILGGVALFIAGRLKAPNPVAEAEKVRQEEERKANAEKSHIGKTLPKPLVYTVNIGAPGEEHFLKCSVQLEWETSGGEKGGKEGGEKEGEGGAIADPMGAEIMKRMPKISDIIINILSSQPYQELLKASGKQKIKESIVSEVNAVLPQELGRLKNAFFTDFLVQ